MYDVMNPICIHLGCKTRPNYGALFSKKVHCAEHATLNEYRNNHPKCENDVCKNRPIYTDDGTSMPKRCELHTKSGDDNIVEKKCSSCGLLAFINDAKSECMDCSTFKVAKNLKVKETAVKNALDQAGIKYISYDKIVENGCSKYRPDFVIDCGKYIIVLECDENQHKSYTPECEYGRMYQIYYDLEAVPCIFIRYNPDDYVDKNGTKVRASNSRLQKLISLINTIKNFEVLPHSICIVYAFYDGYNGTQFPIHQLTLSTDNKIILV